MHSQASSLSAPEDDSSAAAFERLLAQINEHLQSVQNALNSAQQNPLELRDHLPTVHSALEQLEYYQQQLGEALISALMHGQNEEVAQACAEWTPDSYVTSTHNAYDKSTASPVYLKAEYPTSTPAGRGAKFVTIQADEEPPRKRRACVLSRIAKPPKEFTPVAQIVPPPKAPPVDLSTVDTSTLFVNGRGFDEQGQRRHRIRLDQCERVHQLVRDAGTPPVHFLQLDQAHSFMGALKKLIDAKYLDMYAELPPAWHHAVTDYITAYARHMQDAVCGQFSDTLAFEGEFETIFRTLTNFSKITEPGFIYGLKKNSEPNDGNTWHESLLSRKARLQHLADEVLTDEEPDEDASDQKSAITDVLRRMHELVENRSDNGTTHEEKILELAREALEHHIDPQHPRLLSALQPYRTEVDAQPDLKPIAKALKAEAKERALEQLNDDANDAEFQSTWPYRAHTEGKKLAIIGGNRRRDAEQNIREAFGFEDVHWISTSSGKHARQRKFESRFKHGSYDFVVAIQNLVGHAWTDMIFNQRPQNTVAALTSGYGVQAIARALVRYSDWEEL